MNWAFGSFIELSIYYTLWKKKMVELFKTHKAFPAHIIIVYNFSNTYLYYTVVCEK